jgi:hypothetical protein
MSDESATDVYRAVPSVYRFSHAVPRHAALGRNSPHNLERNSPVV